MLKLVGGVVVAGLLATFCVGKTVSSYVRTSVSDVTGAMKSAVPLDFEIRRARTMLGDLGPEIRDNMLAIAREEAAIDQLAEQIAEQESKQGQDRTEIVRLKNDLATGKSTFRYAGKEYTARQVETDLSRRFARHKTADETLKNLQAMHDARTKSLAAARDKMNGLLAARRQLEVEIEQLDSRRMMVDAAQTADRLCIDAGSLSRTRQLVIDLKARLAMSEKLVAGSVEAIDEIPLDAENDEDLVARITAYFDEPAQVAEAK